MKVEDLIELLNQVRLGPGSEKGFELQKLFAYVGSKKEIDSLKHGEVWKEQKRTINFTMDFDENSDKKYFCILEGYGCFTKGEESGHLARFVKIIELPDETENPSLSASSEIARILYGNLKNKEMKTAKIYWINSDRLPKDLG